MTEYEKEKIIDAMNTERDRIYLIISGLRNSNSAAIAAANRWRDGMLSLKEMRERGEI